MKAVEKKEYYTYLFIVLTYRNIEDLNDFYKSVSEHVDSYKIIIVNSYYDEASKESIECFSKLHKCDFLNVDNKGYGYGNNKGIEFANNKYEYDYLIVANPDTIIKKFNIPSNKEYGVIAPDIVTRTGKRQNPYWAVKNRFAEYLIYIGYKKKIMGIIYMGIGINKLIRILFLKFTAGRIYKIYAAHGSFIIFTRETVNKIAPIFDEKMFLFSEEAMLAHILEQSNIRVAYVPSIKIFHKEDGSISLAKIDDRSIVRNSVIHYYEKYVIHR